jgi:hypothetical protein
MVTKKDLAVAGSIAGALGTVAVIVWRARRGHAQPYGVQFAGFKEELRNEGVHTTTRKSDNEQGYDFWYFPLIDITPDVLGTYEISWNWVNNNGASSGNIVNTVNINSAVVTRVQLVDSRPDNKRGGSIAYGDPDEHFDGLWWLFHSDVTVTIKSPSGATVTVSGSLEDQFKSVMGSMSASFVGFNAIKK